MAGFMVYLLVTSLQVALSEMAEEILLDLPSDHTQNLLSTAETFFDRLLEKIIESDLRGCEDIAALSYNTYLCGVIPDEDSSEVTI